MRIDVPAAAVQAGFVNEPVGTHTSRTMMLPELRSLLGGLPVEATYQEYRTAAIEQNAVHKGSLATRAKTFRHLRELFGLSPSIPIFRALRLLWESDQEGQPVLAALCATARDPVLRSTLDYVVQLSPGDEATPYELADILREAFPGHYSEGVAARAGRNLASTWRQAGLLAGRARKVRQHPFVPPTAVAYALFLGYLCEASGDLLVRTPWARLLDLSEREMRAQAAVASRRGWLEYRQAGGVTEVTFRHLLSQEEP